MKLKKIGVAAVVVAIIAGSAIVSYTLIMTKPSTPKKEQSVNITGVRTEVADYQNHQLEINYPGRVESRASVKLTPEVTGKIIAGDVVLKEGNRFKKGDIILNIFSEDANVKLQAEKSLFLNTLSGALPDIKIDFPDQYDKWINFFSAIDLSKPLPTLPKLNSDKEKVYISSKNILSSYYNIETSEIILTRYQVKAPFNGVFTSVSREVGSLATPSAEVATIVSTDALEIVTGVFFADAQKLNKGAKVEIDAKSGKTYNGRVDRIAPFIDPTTQRVNIYITFSEPEMEIIEGQMLNVKLPSSTLSETLKVNRAAIQGDTLIYVVSGDTVEPTIIETVATTPEYSYIKGIKSGERFVNESLIAPYKGMKINTLNMNGEPVK